MKAALVAFILDFLFLIGFSIVLINLSGGEIFNADFIIDFLVHIWVLVYLIIGVSNIKGIGRRLQERVFLMGQKSRFIQMNVLILFEQKSARIRQTMFCFGR